MSVPPVKCMVPECHYSVQMKLTDNCQVCCHCLLKINCGTTSNQFLRPYLQAYLSWQHQGVRACFCAWHTRWMTTHENFGNKEVWWKFAQGEFEGLLLGCWVSLQEQVGEAGLSSPRPQPNSAFCLESLCHMGISWCVHLYTCESRSEQLPGMLLQQRGEGHGWSLLFVRKQTND